jgi:hypothetical protein
MLSAGLLSLFGTIVKKCQLGKISETPPNTPLSTNKPGMVVNICNPSYMGGP